ncbi:hypothetical protein [Alloscardovia omnicolens]|uniref:hypothetical protein n=1 Tax=Alloscardovia omnicolens TaxID=419015 RepID=UPI002889315E|nr:hypothetical protein [Alloscardovia omnicolens]
MAKRKAVTFSDEWDFTHVSGVRAHVVRLSGTATFRVTFSRTNGLELANGEYEIQTDSKYIPHSIVNRIIADDIAAAQRAHK